MSKPSMYRQPLGRGFLVASLLHGGVTLAVLALTVSIVAVAARRGADAAGLETLRGAAEAVTGSVARLSVDPSRTAWTELRGSHTALVSAARVVVNGPASRLPEVAEIGRLLDTILPDPYGRVSQVVEAGVLGVLDSPESGPAERLDARGELDAPLAAYLKTLEQLVVQMDRTRAAWGQGESRTLSVLLLAALLLAALGLGGAGAFLAGFWKATNADLRALAAYGGKIARGEYPDGNLPDRNDSLGDLARSLQRLTRLEKVLFDVKDLSVAFQASSRHIGAQVEAAVSRSSRQSGRIDGAVRMVDDIVQAIQTVYTNARRSLETAEESGWEIGTSIEKLLHGASDVRQLEELTNRVGEIVSLISSIADQTDILSLNAGIEAARAGSYGRGFTVVASEVRKLADKSGRSALEISELTQSILSVVQKIASRTNEESVVMSSIQKGLGRIIEAVGQVTQVSETARDSIEGLSKAIDEITGGIADAQRDASELAKTVREHGIDVERLRAAGSEIRFSVSTASFAEWSAAEESEAVGGNEEPLEVEAPERPDVGGTGTTTQSAATASPVEAPPPQAVAVAVETPAGPTAGATKADDEVPGDLETVD